MTKKLFPLSLSSFSSLLCVVKLNFVWRIKKPFREDFTTKTLKWKLFKSNFFLFLPRFLVAFASYGDFVFASSYCTILLKINEQSLSAASLPLLKAFFFDTKIDDENFFSHRMYFFINTIEISSWWEYFVTLYSLIFSPLSMYSSSQNAFLCTELKVLLLFY